MKRVLLWALTVTSLGCLGFYLEGRIGIALRYLTAPLLWAPSLVFAFPDFLFWRSRFWSGLFRDPIRIVATLEFAAALLIAPFWMRLGLAALTFAMAVANWVEWFRTDLPIAVVRWLGRHSPDSTATAVIEVIGSGNGDDNYYLDYQFCDEGGEVFSGQYETGIDIIHVAHGGHEDLLRYLTMELKQPGAITVTYWRRHPRVHEIQPPPSPGVIPAHLASTDHWGVTPPTDDL